MTDKEKELRLTKEEIIIAVCGDCPFEGRFTDEDCHACQRQLEGVSTATVAKARAHYEPLIEEARKENIELLKKAVELIKVWHNGEAVMKLGQEQAEYMWNIYYNHAPEMKEIRQALSAPEGNKE